MPTTAAFPASFITLFFFFFFFCHRAHAQILPPWPPTYNLSQSTIIMPCQNSGYYATTSSNDLPFRFGIADYDWSNAKSLWALQHPMDCEERLVAQAVLNKKANPSAHVWVYRNLVKALPWYTSVREKLADPAYGGFFLKFKPDYIPHVSKCDHSYDPPLCSELYHDQLQTPEPATYCGNRSCDCGGVPCGEYLFDHRNGSMLTDWIIKEYIGGPTAMGHPDIDGLFIDDGWSRGSPSEEDSHALEDCGLLPTDVKEISHGWEINMMAAWSTIVKAAGFNWQLLNCDHVPEVGNICHGETGGPPLVTMDTCTLYMRNYCRADNPLYKQALLMTLQGGADHVHFPLQSVMQDLARFLLLRGDYAWLGYGWTGCNSHFVRPKELDNDYGIPTGDCHETGANTQVFAREYSKATVRLDCNSWTAEIVMK